MPKRDEEIKELQRTLGRLRRLVSPVIRCVEGFHAFACEAKDVRDPRPILDAIDALGTPTLASMAAGIPMRTAPFPVTAVTLATARHDIRKLRANKALALVREAPRSFRAFGGVDDAWLRKVDDRIAQLAHVLRAPQTTDRCQVALDVVCALQGDESADRAKKIATGDARVRRIVASYAMLFRPRGEKPLTRRQIELGTEKLEDVVDALAGRALAFEDVFAILPFDTTESELRLVGEWVSEGLEVELLTDVFRAGALQRVLDLEAPDLRTVRAFCTWTAKLVPHFRARGAKVELPPSLFRSLRRSHHEDLAVLAHCLLEDPAADAALALDRRLLALDAMLGLFRTLPKSAHALAERIGHAPDGVARKTFPEFAEWLGDDALLDRVVHLAELAGEPPLSKTLLRDFSRMQRNLDQMRYLDALPYPTAKQSARRALLETRRAEAPNAWWTRKRLVDRAISLGALALNKQLDDLFREVLREVWGIAVPTLTPAWRDAVRFYLNVDSNRDHLATLLRHCAAHPGKPIATTLRANHAWIARARSKMDLDAWLGPHREEVTIGDKRYVLAAESDPIEVLRMGIPFDTCLSLQSGCNAASTVVNALDANKRVLYLRDEQGTIVARKLLAVSKDFTLVGYEVYVAITDKKTEVQAAFRKFCRALGRRVGLALAPNGDPEQLHQGFWYDDGTIAFDQDDVSGEVAAFCAALGRPIPAKTSALVDEANAHAARTGNDMKRAIDLLSRWGTALSNSDLGDWIVATLGERESLRRARRAPELVPPLLRSLDGDPTKLFRVVSEKGIARHSVDALLEALEAHAPSTAIADAMVSAAIRAMRAAKRADNHGIEHATFDQLGDHLEHASVAHILEVCDRIGPVWDWVIADLPRCSNCRELGEARIDQALWLAYAREPDPGAVVACLRDERRGKLAQSIALRLAAKVPLVPREPFSLLDRFEACAPVASIAGLAAVRALRRARPELASDPRMLAAMLRQSSPSKLDRSTLPTPRSAPFEALADLHMHYGAALEPMLAPWCAPEVSASSWSPGTWERFHHRRHATKLRQRLAKEARSRATGSAALAWLAVLGDVEAVKVAEAARATQKRAPSMTPRGTPIARHPIVAKNAHLALAHDVAKQIRDEDERLPAIKKLTKGKPQPPPAVSIDPNRMRRALRAFARYFEDPTDRESEARRAFDVLLLAHTHPADWNEVVDRLIERVDRPGYGGAREMLARWLSERIGNGMRGVSPTRIARLLGAPQLHNDVMDALLRSGSHAWSRFCDRIVRASEQIPGLRIDDLHASWAARLLTEDRHLHTLCNVEGREAHGRVFRATLASRNPERILAIYRYVGDYVARSLMLDEMAKLPEDERTRLREQVAKGTWESDDMVGCRAWLDAALGTA